MDFLQYIEGQRYTDQTVRMSRIILSFSVNSSRNGTFLKLHNIWAALCQKVFSGICGQRRPRSDCASAQSDQGLRCPLTVIGYYRMFEWRANARLIFYACIEWFEYAQFAPVRRPFCLKRAISRFTENSNTFANRDIEDPNQPVHSHCPTKPFADRWHVVGNLQNEYSDISVPWLVCVRAHSGLESSFTCLRDDGFSCTQSQIGIS